MSSFEKFFVEGGFLIIIPVGIVLLSALWIGICKLFGWEYDKDDDCDGYGNGGCPYGGCY